MSDFINHISIRNFKSIKNCEVNGCKRINLFIGRPNVGKSNIIEALSMFSIPYLKENTSKKLNNLVRFENELELFHSSSLDKEANIQTNVGICNLLYHNKSGIVIHLSNDTNLDLSHTVLYSAKTDDRLSVQDIFTDKSYKAKIKRYGFKQNVIYKKGHSRYLIPTYGSNLLSVIESYPELKEEIVNLFRDYNLEIAFDRASQTIKIIQKNKDGIFLIPYTSIADTLQRLIFYKAAIASNDNSILLFEEPEAHAFPPYMTQLTQDMIYKKDNQYFLATHSSFILNDLLENAPDELGVFVVYWENGSTQVRALSQAEMHEAYQSGVDFFTNSESFIG